MEQVWEVLLQVAELARMDAQDQQTSALPAVSTAVGATAAELRDATEEAFENLWAGAAEQGLSLQSLTGYVVPSISHAHLSLLHHLSSSKNYPLVEVELLTA